MFFLCIDFCATAAHLFMRRWLSTLGTLLVHNWSTNCFLSNDAHCCSPKKTHNYGCFLVTFGLLIKICYWCVVLFLQTLRRPTASSLTLIHKHNIWMACGAYPISNILPTQEGTISLIGTMMTRVTSRWILQNMNHQRTISSRKASKMSDSNFGSIIIMVWNIGFYWVNGKAQYCLITLEFSMF